MVASGFLKNPQGSLTTAPIFEITQEDDLMTIDSLENHTTEVYPEEIGYNSGLICSYLHEYPDITEITNIQLLLD